MAWVVMMGFVATEMSPISPPSQALNGHRKPVVVVAMLPSRQGPRSSCKLVKGCATPKLLLVDAMTSCHPPVLFGPARFDVPQADTGFLHHEGSGQPEFGPIANLTFADGT